MSVILGLLIVCLGLYFLSLFFQVARLEKALTEDVALLEKFMIVTYALDKTGKQEGEEDGGKPDGESKGSAPPPAKTP